MKINFFTIKQLFLVILDQGFTSLTYFLVGALCARAVDKELFGLYILGNSVALILLGFERALITTPFAIIFPSKGSTEKKRYIGDACLFHGAFVIVVVFCILFVELFREPIAGHVSRELIWAIGLTVIGQSFYYFIKYSFLARMQNAQNLILGLICNGAITSAVIILFLEKKLTVSLAYSVVGVSTLLVSSRYFWIMWRESIFSIDSIKESIRSHYKIGKWIVGSNITFIVSAQMFPWLLVCFTGQKDVADFGAAMGATRLLAPVSQGLSSFLLPKLSHLRDNKEKFLKGLLLSLYVTGVVAGLLLVGGLIWGEQICVLLYSEKYAGLGLLILWGCVAQGINFINIPVDAGLNSLERTDVGFKSLLVSAAVAMLFGIPLAWQYGALGACIGSAFAGCSGFVFRALCLRVILVKDKV